MIMRSLQLNSMNKNKTVIECSHPLMLATHTHTYAQFCLFIVVIIIVVVVVVVVVVIVVAAAVGTIFYTHSNFMFENVSSY